jgi:hypothetical protein
MIEVKSSNLKAVGFEDPGTLQVVFNNGDEYHYFKVPKALHDNLLKAPSIGAFFVQFVKKGGFEYKKIEKVVKVAP